MPELPPIGFDRLLVVVTGSIGAAFLPADLAWLRRAYPDLQITTAVTKTANRFVTLDALACITGGETLRDEWPDGGDATHVRLQQWAQAIMVVPATMNYLARLALGLADSPSLLAIHCSTAPVVVAPGLPPGGWDSPVARHHVEAIESRDTVSVIPPIATYSFTTKAADAHGPPPFAAILGTLELTRRRLTEK